MNSPHDVLDALRAELAGVTVSPEFAQKVRTQILAEGQEAELDALSRELAGVSVSPEFAARVRQSVENAPPRWGWLGFLNWRWALPVAAAAALALTTLVWRPDTETPASIVAQGPTSRGATPEASRQLPEETRPNPAMEGGVQTTAQSHVARARPALATPASVSANDKLEVITNQQELFLQMWAVAASAGADPDVTIEVRELAVVPVEVAPVVVQWLVEPPVSSGGSVQDIRRVSAAAERSDK